VNRRYSEAEGGVRATLLLCAIMASEFRG